MKIGHSFTSEATLADFQTGVRELVGKVVAAGLAPRDVKIGYGVEERPTSLHADVPYRPTLHVWVDAPEPAGPVCGACRRERTIHGMDAYDYSPLQMITGQPLGWYSGDDGEMCPECMTDTLRRQ